MAVPGDTQWPSAGTSRDRPRGVPVAASGEIQMAVDILERSVSHVRDIELVFTVSLPRIAGLQARD